jgi:acyl-CoA synthetase (AMP-forming)/AMP-acid ligase II
VGAVVVCDIGHTPDHLGAAARKTLSSFKVPTVWVLVTSDGQLPRGSTGKVDVRRLREMLTATTEVGQ